jgi:hypothetical protein
MAKKQRLFRTERLRFLSLYLFDNVMEIKQFSNKAEQAEFTLIMQLS